MLEVKKQLDELQAIVEGKKPLNKKTRAQALTLIEHVRTVSEIFQKQSENLNMIRSLLGYIPSIPDHTKLWPEDPPLPNQVSIPNPRHVLQYALSRKKK